jgi:hypothetical protein
MKTKPFTLTKADRARVVAAFDELKTIEQRANQIGELRANLEQAAEDFFAGKISLLEALQLRNFDHRAFDQEARALRGYLKTRQRGIPERLKDLIEAYRANLLDELGEQLAAAEEAERQAFRAVGVSADDYRPSAKIERLKSQHAAAQAEIGEEITRHDLEALFITAGLKRPSE